VCAFVDLANLISYERQSHVIDNGVRKRHHNSESQKGWGTTVYSVSAVVDVTTMRILINDFCGHAFPLEMSRELARRGHTVLHVYFADNLSTPKGHTQVSQNDPEGLMIEGLHIARAFAKHSLLTRRQADIEYGRVTASRVEMFRPDVVLSGNMPLDAQSILQRAAHRYNARFVFWLQDVYCLAARFVLQRKARVLAWAGEAYFKRLERKLLKESDAVICISDGFAETIRAWGIDGPNVHVIGNWAPLDEVRPRTKQNPWAVEHGLADDFCFVYSGTLGMKHRPELLLGLAKHLEASRSGKLVVVAGGAGADWLAANSKNVDPSVLKLLPFQPYERVAEVMGSADVLITLLDSDAGSFAVPSKTLSYLCAGRALIVAAPETNEAARIAQRAEAGIVISPDCPDRFLEAAERFLKNRKLCADCGMNGREFAERTFAIDTIADRFLSVLAPDSVLNETFELELEGIEAETSVETTGAI
jgi:colanic acid biosynthesis glycosyl transferase WcaI